MMAHLLLHLRLSDETLHLVRDPNSADRREQTHGLQVWFLLDGVSQSACVQSLHGSSHWSMRSTGSKWRTERGQAVMSSEGGNIFTRASVHSAEGWLTGVSESMFPGGTVQSERSSEQQEFTGGLYIFLFSFPDPCTHRSELPAPINASCENRLRPR